jgi:hypothetical protein
MRGLIRERLGRALSRLREIGVSAELREKLEAVSNLCVNKIEFRQHAVKTFFSMLPASIAFIVFSSPLYDLIRGRISLTFVIGLFLVVFISILPLLYRRYRAERGEVGAGAR